jgi:hypothetical protein
VLVRTADTKSRYFRPLLTLGFGVNRRLTVEASRKETPSARGTALRPSTGVSGRLTQFNRPPAYIPFPIVELLGDRRGGLSEESGA